MRSIVFISIGAPQVDHNRLDRLPLLLVAEPEPSSNCSPQARRPCTGMMRSSGRAVLARFFPWVYVGEVDVAEPLISKASVLDLLAAHVAGPHDSALPNQVVRPAGQAPVPDRGTERDAAVGDLQRPAGGVQRGY